MKSTFILLTLSLISASAFATDLTKEGSEAKALYNAIGDFLDPSCDDTSCSTEVGQVECPSLLGLCFVHTIQNGAPLVIVEGESAEALTGALGEFEGINCRDTLCEMNVDHVSCVRTGSWWSRKHKCTVSVSD